MIDASAEGTSSLDMVDDGIDEPVELRAGVLPLDPNRGARELVVGRIEGDQIRNVLAASIMVGRSVELQTDEIEPPGELHHERSERDGRRPLVVSL